MYQQPPQQQQGVPPLQGPPSENGRKRANDEPHTPTLPPPNPAEQNRTGSAQYNYPDPMGVGLNPAGASPASSTASFHSAQPAAQSYYGVQLAHRASPQSAYSYDASRASSSPHTLGQSGTPAPPTSHHLQPAVPTPPPSSAAAANAQLQGVKIEEIVGLDGQQQLALLMKQEERTSTDTNMVQALNRGPM